jgi:predicted hotdog family 3-hydroxylacyl-ACP dehydratase
MDIPIDIKKYLPHRAPMLMVDWILFIDKEKAKTIFEIKQDNIFTNNNQFAEAGLIENAAQTCSAIVGRDYFVDEEMHDRFEVDVVGFISTIKTLKIHKLPGVGNTIYTAATLISKFATDSYILCTMSFRIFNQEQLFAEGEMNLVIRGNSNKRPS